MKGKAEDLRTDQARQTRDTKDRASKGSSKVCVFPGKADAEIQMAKATAKRLNIPFVDPLRAAIEPSALSLLNPDVAIGRQDCLFALSMIRFWLQWHPRKNLSQLEASKFLPVARFVQQLLRRVHFL